MRVTKPETTARSGQSPHPFAPAAHRTRWRTGLPGQDRIAPPRTPRAVSLSHWHGSALLLQLTLIGDVLALAFAAFGDATGRYRMPHLFWWILWLAQIPLGIQLATGIAVLAAGARPRAPLHLMYGGLIVLTVLALAGLRPGGVLRRAFVADEREYRESRWLLLLCLFLAALVGRAYMTGLGSR